MYELKHTVIVALEYNNTSRIRARSNILIVLLLCCDNIFFVFCFAFVERRAKDGLIRFERSERYSFKIPRR